MKLFNQINFPIIAILWFLSFTFAADDSINAAAEVQDVSRRTHSNSKPLTDFPDVLQGLIVHLAGTKSTHGICRKWRNLNLGNPDVYGLGSFSIGCGFGPKDPQIETYAYGRKLALHYLHIKDISALGRVQNLILHYLLNVSDVSALGSVQNLTLDGIGVSDIFPLRSVPKLIMIRMDHLGVYRWTTGGDLLFLVHPEKPGAGSTKLNA